MKLTYIYHSCFLIEANNFDILIDYYKDSTDDSQAGLIHRHVLENGRKLYVLSTHSHTDHFNPEILEWSKQKQDITYIFSKEIGDSGKAKPEDGIYLDKLETFTDCNIEVKAFGSTDIGGSFLIKAEGKIIYHAGDLNNWHWNEESTPEEAADAEIFYLNELKLVSNDVEHLDLAMFPIDPRLGKDYMKGAIQFVNKIKTDILAPMHFGEAYSKIASFKEIALEVDCKCICWEYRGESLTILN